MMSSFPSILTMDIHRLSQPPVEITNEFTNVINIPQIDINKDINIGKN